MTSEVVQVISKTIIVFTGKCNYEFKSNIHVKMITASVTQVTRTSSSITRLCSTCIMMITCDMYVLVAI